MTPQCEVDGSEIPVRSTSVVKCLRYWWRGDLMATCSVEGNIRKACKFAFAMEDWVLYIKDCGVEAGLLKRGSWLRVL